MKNLLRDGRTTSNTFWVDTFRTLFGPCKLLASSLSNLILGMDSGVVLSMFLIQSLFSSFSFLVIVSLMHRSVFTRSVEYKLPRIFISAPLCRCCDFRVIFGCSRVVAGAWFFVPSDGSLWFSRRRAVQGSVQYGFALLLPCCVVSCVINYLPLCVSATCTVRWSFLHHVVRNR